MLSGPFSQKGPGFPPGSVDEASRG